LGPSADVFRLSTPAGMIMIHGTATRKVPRLSGKASTHRYCSLIHLIPPLRLLYTFPVKGRGPHRLASMYIPSGSSIKSSRPASRFGGTIANRLCMLWGSHCPRLIPGDNFEAKKCRRSLQSNTWATSTSGCVKRVPFQIMQLGHHRFVWGYAGVGTSRPPSTGVKPSGREVLGLQSRRLNESSGPTSRHDPESDCEPYIALVTISHVLAYIKQDHLIL
jgi:hypothetical protein